MRSLLYLLIILLTANLAVANDIDAKRIELYDQYFQMKRSSKAMFQYGLDVSNQIWYSHKLIKKCAPSGVKEASVMYYKIDTNGEVDEVWLFPFTKEGECVKKNLLKMKFSKPKATFIGFESIESEY